MLTLYRHVFPNKGKDELEEWKAGHQVSKEFADKMAALVRIPKSNGEFSIDCKKLNEIFNEPYEKSKFG